MIKSITWQEGLCDAGFTRVRQLTHCASEGTMFTLPQYGLNLSVGRVVLYSTPIITTTELADCTAYTGNAPACEAAQAAAEADHNINYTGVVTMNNVTAVSYDCGGVAYAWRGPPGANNLFGPWGAAVTTSARDAVCCQSQ